VQQPRPPRPTTMARASLDALHFAGRDAAGFDAGVDSPPQRFWEELAAARERVSSSLHLLVQLLAAVLIDAWLECLHGCTDRSAGPVRRQKLIAWCAGAQHEQEGAPMMAKMRTSMDVKAAVEAVRSDFLQHGRRRGNTTGAPVAASGSWNAAAGAQGPLAGLPEGWGEPHALQAAVAALAGPMFAGGGSVRRGSQPMSMPSSRRASGGTVRRLSHVSQQPQQDAWGLLPCGDAGPMLGGGPPQAHRASVSRSSIKRTSVDLSSLDPQQLAATGAPVAVQEDYMDPFRAARFAQHEAEQMQHAQRMHFERGAGSGPIHHPSISAASVGSLMDWARPAPQHQLPPGGAVWAGVGRTSVDSAAAGMLRRAAPSAPYPGSAGYRAGPPASVGRNSMPSSIKRGSGTGMRSAVGPVTFGPPPNSLDFEHGHFMPPAPPPMDAPIEPGWKPSVARRSFQRPVRSEAVANLLAEGPVRSGPIWGSNPAADVDAMGITAPPMAARRPYRSVRAASEGGRRGLAGGRESFLATAARLSTRFGTVADAGGASSVPLMMGQPLATVEPSEGSLTSMCALTMCLVCFYRGSTGARQTASMTLRQARSDNSVIPDPVIPHKTLTLNLHSTLTVTLALTRWHLLRRATSLLADATAPYIIAAEELTVKQRIGGGCSGSVHLGKWQETDVAIKVRPVAFSMLAWDLRDMQSW